MAWETDALLRLALFADDLADTFELCRHGLVGRHHVVDGVCDFSNQARPMTR
jgi:hypothetical protein